MEELKENHQLCYQHPRNALGIAMNLLNFGYRQFGDTYLYLNHDPLKIICENIELKQPNIPEIGKYAINNLMDSIKIQICLENFLKAIFLIKGVIVHRLDRNIFPELYKRQTEKPILISQLLKLTSWVENPKINLPSKDFRMQIKGISENTLGTKTLMQSEYLESINFNQKSASLFYPYLEYRNNLHYYTEESITLTSTTFSNLQRIIKFVNLNVVEIQNKIVHQLGKGDYYKLRML
jgi:hypothetical protein